MAGSHLEIAMGRATEFVMSTWQQTVLGAVRLPNVAEITSNINLRRIYANSIVLMSRIDIPDAGRHSRTVFAPSQVAVDLEYGKGPFDMKPMLLAGRKAKAGKNGKRYVTVPFRHGVPGGTKNSVFRSMPADVYAEARKLKKGKMLPATALANHRAMPHVIALDRKTGEVLRDPIVYKHKDSIYAGMKRTEHKYETATQSKYMTFRRVSENSDPQSWWHPGYRPHNIARGVQEYCKPAVEDMLMNAATLDLANVVGVAVGMTVTVF